MARFCFQWSHATDEHARHTTCFVLNQNLLTGEWRQIRACEWEPSRVVGMLHMTKTMLHERVFLKTCNPAMTTKNRHCIFRGGCQRFARFFFATCNGLTGNCHQRSFFFFNR